MASTFMGLNIGAGALSSFQTSVNTTANNISNSKTKGYTRQTATLEATQALRVTARYGSIGTGVNVTEITQERDLFYDERYWRNNSSLGIYETKVYYYEQMQGYFKDDNTQTGFSTLFAKMYNNLDSLISDGVGDESVRNQFINSAKNVCTYFNSLADSLSVLQSDVNEQIKTTVEQVNSIAKKVALLNQEISMIEVRGVKANELRDERANLVDQLSQIVNVEIKEVEVQNTYGDNLGNTYYTIDINGQRLVDNDEYRELVCVSQDYKNNQNDIDGLYKIIWSDTGNNFAATTLTAGGSLKALFDVRDGNNNETLKGKITDFTTGDKTLPDADGNPVTKTMIDTVTISGSALSVTDLDKLAIAGKGEITISNRSYVYDSWKAEVNEDGEIVSYTFNLTNGVDLKDFDTVMDRNLTVGKEIDCMGIPYYMEQINEFLRNYTEMFNDIEESGETLDGQPMGAFFVAKSLVDTTEYTFSDWNYDDDGHRITGTPTGKVDANGKNTYEITSTSDTYYLMTATSLAVNDRSFRDAKYFATTKTVVNGVDAYDLVTELQKLESDVEMFRGDGADKFLETLLSDVAIDTSEANTFLNTYNNLEVSINNLRTSVSGVDEDEEALNLVKFQNAYNMASKVISVMSEMYDKLINETGR